MLLGQTTVTIGLASVDSLEGCRVAYCPELQPMPPSVNPLRHSEQPWDLAGAWWLEARVRYESQRVEDVEFAVVPEKGERLLAAAQRVLERMCVLEAQIYSVRRPMSPQLINEIRAWNAQQAKRILALQRQQPKVVVLPDGMASSLW